MQYLKLFKYLTYVVSYNHSFHRQYLKKKLVFERVKSDK